MNSKERDALITDNLVLVRINAHHWAGWHNVDRDDLEGEGYLGLIEAADGFDPARGVRFETYAIGKIRAAMWNLVRTNDPLPRSLRVRINRIEVGRAQVRQRTGKKATNAQVAKEIGAGEDAVIGWLKTINTLYAQDLDAVISRDTGGDTTKGEMLASPDALPEDVVIARDERRRMLAEVCRLPHRLRYVLWMRYRREMTLKQMGARLGCNNARAFQLLRKAYAQMRLRMS